MLREMYSCSYEKIWTNISPRYGIAEHSAFVAGEVKFNEDTSWSNPTIKDWTDVKKIALIKFSFFSY